MHKTYFNWSTGKDSALALYYLQKDNLFKVKKLVTTINNHYNRVTMHGLRRELLNAQIKALDIPFQTIELPEQPTIKDYEAIMYKSINELKDNKFTHSAFGDIFLEDLKQYRVNQLSQLHIECVFPLWKKNTIQLIHEFVALGFKAVVICADATYFDESFIGTEIDTEFISKLPENVDPCGENGEFHTFCYDGPIFKYTVPFQLKETIYREYDTPNTTNEKSGFWYGDLTLDHQNH